MSREINVIGSGYSFLEGARWHAGRLFVSDFYTHRILAFDESGAMETICTVPDQPSGLGFAPDGRLLIVLMRDRRLLSLIDGRLRETADLSTVAAYHCNDMLVDRHGRAYVGNFGWNPADDPRIHPAALALVRPDGSVTVAAENLIFPNGIAVTPDGKTLLVAETLAGRISAFDVAEDGRLRNRRIWASFVAEPFSTVDEAMKSGVPLPDGIALDAEEGLWIADAGGRGALRIAEGGRILDSVFTDSQSVYSVALGGRDLRTLYMCAAEPMFSNNPALDHRSRLLACKVPVPGAL